MSVARFIADQRTNYRVPHAKVCQWLEISLSWFYKWIQRSEDPAGLHTDTDRRRALVDAAVAQAFRAARGLHGSPRLWADLRDLGWQLSEKTVAESMRRQGLVARRIKRRHGALGLIVVDYLQLIEPDNPRDPRQEQVAKIARRLKGNARAPLDFEVVGPLEDKRPAQVREAWPEIEQAERMRACLERLRQSGKASARDLAVFDQYAVQRRPVERVAEQFGISRSRVYVIKSEIIRHLRRLYKKLDEHLGEV